MDIIALEDVCPYKNNYIYDLYLYDDEIEIGNKNSYICRLKFVKIEVEEMYKTKGFSNIGYAIVDKYNPKCGISQEELVGKVSDFILEEIPLLDVDKGNIDVILSLNK